MLKILITINSFIEYWILFPVIAFMMMMVSCEKEVTLDLSDQQGLYLIVEADIDDAASRQWIRLSNSSSYYDISTGSPVTEAVVSITYVDTVFTFNESSIDSLRGYYFNNDIGNKLSYGDYELAIEHEGKIFTAFSEYRPVPALDSVTLRLNFFSSAGFTDELLYDVNVHFRELPGSGDHYLANISINDSLITRSPSQKTVISDEDLQEYVSLSISTINGDGLNDGDMLSVELRSISRANYDFYQLFFFQTDLSGNPFAGAPPANIPTNLSEGARGFFQVSSVSMTTMAFKDATGPLFAVAPKDGI
jgi:hypothetical protein